ncbi:hypothetical protein F4804DRAFT_335269 [Jackrogersella minutella]|nr:hypothetical protein F4804DRAFT_335269 [Jackrogersella minutella]
MGPDLEQRLLEEKKQGLRVQHLPWEPPKPRKPQAPPIKAPPKASRPFLKRVILTGAFAAVAVVGAIYGAGLKTQEERKQERQKIVEASPEVRIQELERRRATLLRQRRPIERKRDDVRARIKAQEIKDGADTAAVRRAESENDDKDKQ